MKKFSEEKEIIFDLSRDPIYPAYAKNKKNLSMNSHIRYLNNVTRTDIFVEIEPVVPLLAFNSWQPKLDNFYLETMFSVFLNIPKRKNHSQQTVTIL